MVHRKIYNECIKNLNAMYISIQAKKNGEYPFGYVIDYLKDVYGLSKIEGWETAKEICKYFRF